MRYRTVTGQKCCRFCFRRRQSVWQFNCNWHRCWRRCWCFCTVLCGHCDCRTHLPI